MKKNFRYEQPRNMAEVAATFGVLLRRPETKKKPLNQKRNLKTKNRGDDDYHPLPPPCTHDENTEH